MSAGFVSSSMPTSPTTPAAATVAVVGGAGLMGRLICAELALCGCRVVLNGLSQTDCAGAFESVLREVHYKVRRGLLLPQHLEMVRSNITLDPTLATAVAEADIVLECVPDDLNLKRRVFAEICEHCKPQAVLGSNTMTMPIADIAAGLPYANRVMGIRFLHPVLLIDELELSSGRNTERQVYDQANSFFTALGKLCRAGDTQSGIYYRINPIDIDRLQCQAGEIRKMRLQAPVNVHIEPSAPDLVEVYGGAMAYYTDGQMSTSGWQSVHGARAPEPEPAQRPAPEPTPAPPPPPAEPDECCICLDEKKIMACVPCGHLCLCNNCANQLVESNDRCPICRTSIMSVVHVYRA